MIKHTIDIAIAGAASSARGWRGMMANQPAIKQPEQLLKLYDWERSPFCLLVREALTELDLDVEIRPCPKGGSRFRDELQNRNVPMMVPYLVDPNTGREMHESADIIDYLFATYGGRPVPAKYLPRPVHVGSAAATTVLRAGGGMHASPSTAPAQALELFSFEASPFSRPVRELLCELELPYILRNTGKALYRDIGTNALRKRLFPDLEVVGRNRQNLLQRAGKVQVPYLIDPNTGVEMFESTEIMAYLRSSYGTE